MRDTRRMERLARYLLRHSRNNDDGGHHGNPQNNERIDWGAAESAADYLINFNMAGLHRVESKMFVGWLRDNLNRDAVARYCDNGKEVARAFEEVIDEIDRGRIKSAQLGNELYQNAKLAKTPQRGNQHLAEIIRLSAQLSAQLRQTRHLQETLLVPSISITVSSSAQKSFNNRVLLKLGVLESRVHLVGMHDAVGEEGEDERIKFEREIPYVARVMIGRWRKSLYEPKAGMLDYGLN